MISFSVIFRYFAPSGSDTPEPRLLKTFTVLWLVLAFQKMLNFHDFSIFFRHAVLERFFISFRSHFGSMLGAFWHKFPDFFGIVFLTIFGSIFVGFWSQKETIRSCRGALFSVLFRTSIPAPIFYRFWIDLGPILVAFWT